MKPQYFSLSFLFLSVARASRPIGTDSVNQFVRIASSRLFLETLSIDSKTVLNFKGTAAHVISTNFNKKGYVLVKTTKVSKYPSGIEGKFVRM